MAPGLELSQLTLTHVDLVRIRSSIYSRLPLFRDTGLSSSRTVMAASVPD